jgi:hypothetical protein
MLMAFYAVVYLFFVFNASPPLKGWAISVGLFSPPTVERMGGRRFSEPFRRTHR